MLDHEELNRLRREDDKQHRRMLIVIAVVSFLASVSITWIATHVPVYQVQYEIRIVQPSPIVADGATK